MNEKQREEIKELVTLFGGFLQMRLEVENMTASMQAVASLIKAHNLMLDALGTIAEASPAFSGHAKIAQETLEKLKTC